MMIYDDARTRARMLLECFGEKLNSSEMRFFGREDFFCLQMVAARVCFRDKMTNIYSAQWYLVKVHENVEWSW